MLYILISCILFICIDGIYLSLVRNYFDKQIMQIQGSRIQLNYTATLITYFFLIFGLNYFIINKNESILNAFLFGIVIYSVYEFTNLSIFKNWKWFTALLDTTWGGILFALTTFLIYKIKKIVK